MGRTRSTEAAPREFYYNSGRQHRKGVTDYPVPVDREGAQPCFGLWKLFHPTSGQEERRAKALCNGTDDRPECPFRSECLSYATTAYETGIWGGTNDTERKDLRQLGVTLGRQGV